MSAPTPVVHIPLVSVERIRQGSPLRDCLLSTRLDMDSYSHVSLGDIAASNGAADAVWAVRLLAAPEAVEPCLALGCAIVTMIATAAGDTAALNVLESFPLTPGNPVATEASRVPPVSIDWTDSLLDYSVRSLASAVSAAGLADSANPEVARLWAYHLFLAVNRATYWARHKDRPDLLEAAVHYVVSYSPRTAASEGLEVTP
jgi:hypothetical protein